MICGIELTRYKSREQTSDGRAYLMAAGREPFSDHADDLCIHACKLLGKYKEIRLSELSALFLGLIVPCDPEKVQGIDIPESDILQFLADLAGNLLGIPHLREGGKNDVPLLCAVDILLKHLFVSR